MLNDFLSEGCGATSDNDFHCLQEAEDPHLRVCCAWQTECLAKKKELLQDTGEMPGILPWAEQRAERRAAKARK